MEGHVRIGPVGDLRDYLINEPRAYTRANANQMAAKLGTGAGDYSDLTSWTAFLMDDWQAGVGKKDPEAGGFRYAEAETRWPNRIQLSLALLAANQADSTNYALNTGTAPGVLKAESSLAIGAASTIKKFSKAIKGNGTKLIGVHICLLNDDAIASVRVSLYSTTGSPAKPNASIALVDEYLDTTIGKGNHFIPFDYLTVDGTNYHIAIEPTDPTETLNLPIDISSSSAIGDLVSTYNGSAWTGGYLLGRPLLEPVLSMPAATASVDRLIYFPATGYMYAAAGAILYHQVDDASKWVSVHTFGATITDLHTDGDTLFIGLGDSVAHQSMDSSETLTIETGSARIFTRWNGYLWWAVSNLVYYTNGVDPTVGPIVVCPAGFSVNGLSGQGDYMYAAADDALYYIGFADKVYTVTPWGQLNPSENFGAGMVNWQGGLYMPVAQGIIRYDQSSMLPVGPDLGEGLPLFRSGNIGALATQNNWLYAIVVATGGASTVWAYNGQGWHFVTVAPAADLLYFTSIYYNRVSQRLYLGTNAGAIFYVASNDSPNSIDTDSPSFTATTGSLETDWFYGGLRDVDKDFESVTILGDDIDSEHTIQVYWQDDGSEGVWELLGEVTANGQELRWTDYTTRPNTKQIKIGVILNAKNSNIPTGTPIVRAIRVKFHNMVTDTWRWNFPLRVSDDQTLADGTENNFSAADMVAHLDGMTKQVAPIIFEDLDSVAYECKIMDATRGIDNIERIDDVQTTTYIYRITLEQVTKGAYGGPI